MSHPDPVTEAAARYESAQSAYDRARLAGRPLSETARTLVAMRLALARSDLQAVVRGGVGDGTECAEQLCESLRYRLPALNPQQEAK